MSSACGIWTPAAYGRPPRHRPRAGAQSRNPVYGVPVPTSATPRYDGLERNYQTGLYLQDQVKIAERWMLTLGGRYDWYEQKLANRLTCKDSRQEGERFSGRAGLRYVGATYGDNRNTLKIDAHTLVDAGLSYTYDKQLTISVNATNLFDKDYLATCSDLTDCYAGNRRSVIGRVQYRC